MNVAPVGGHQPFYTSNEIKSELKLAGTSAVLSAGLTYALNNPRSIKTSLQAGGIVAGISLAYGALRKAYILHKQNKAE